MASETEICNSALLRVGSKPITSLLDENPQADTCNRLYPGARDSVLAEHEWSFCLKRATLTQLAATPAFGFDFQYQLPGDVLKIIEPFTSQKAFHEFRWHREGDTVLTNETDFGVVYKAKITDVSKFGSDFRRVVESLLASQLAYPLKKDAQLASFLYRQYISDLASAIDNDTRESDFRNTIEEDEVFDSFPILDVR
jgi:hypothetical protein